MPAVVFQSQLQVNHLILFVLILLFLYFVYKPPVSVEKDRPVNRIGRILAGSAMTGDINISRKYKRFRTQAVNRCIRNTNSASRLVSKPTVLDTHALHLVTHVK